jgi:hypothetical protein
MYWGVGIGSLGASPLHSWHSRAVGFVRIGLSLIPPFGRILGVLYSADLNCSACGSVALRIKRTALLGMSPNVGVFVAARVGQFGMFGTGLLVWGISCALVIGAFGLELLRAGPAILNASGLS